LAQNEKVCVAQNEERRILVARRLARGLITLAHLVIYNSQSTKSDYKFIALKLHDGRHQELVCNKGNKMLKMQLERRHEALVLFIALCDILIIPLLHANEHGRKARGGGRPLHNLSLYSASDNENFPNSFFSGAGGFTNTLLALLVQGAQWHIHKEPLGRRACIQL
jgi:hypothetical protein